MRKIVSVSRMAAERSGRPFGVPVRENAAKMPTRKFFGFRSYAKA